MAENNHTHEHPVNPAAAIEGRFTDALEYIEKDYVRSVECVTGTFDLHRPALEDISPFLEKIVLVSLKDLHGNIADKIRPIVRDVVNKYRQHEAAKAAKDESIEVMINAHNRWTTCHLWMAALDSKELKETKEELVEARSILTMQRGQIERLRDDLQHATAMVESVSQERDRLVSNLQVIKDRVDKLMMVTNDDDDDDDVPNEEEK